jgi:hypothetical protein
MNDKEGTTFLAEGVLPHGINFALIEYTLAPAARLDRIVQGDATDRPNRRAWRETSRVSAVAKTVVPLERVGFELSVPRKIYYRKRLGSHGPLLSRTRCGLLIVRALGSRLLVVTSKCHAKERQRRGALSGPAARDDHNEH